MTDAPKPPKRRRRQIIVALVLVLVSLVLWWNWPRGDARFVGKWHQLHANGSLKSVVIMDRQGNYIDLPYLSDQPTGTTTYEVLGDELVIHWSGNLLRRIWKIGLWTSLKRLIAGKHELLFESKWPFSFVSSDHILFHGNGRQVEWQLRRAPD